MPNKTTYVQGDNLDTTGLVICGLYTDGTENEFVGFSIGNFISEVIGKQSILITYDVFSTEFEVIVNEKEVISSDETLPEPDTEIKPEPDNEPVTPTEPITPDIPDNSEEIEVPSDTSDITDPTPDSSTNTS